METEGIRMKEMEQNKEKTNIFQNNMEHIQINEKNSLDN